MNRYLEYQKNILKGLAIGVVVSSVISLIIYLIIMDKSYAKGLTMVIFFVILAIFSKFSRIFAGVTFFEKSFSK